MAIPVAAASGDSIQTVASEISAIDSTTVDTSVGSNNSFFPFPLHEPSAKEIRDFQSGWGKALLSYRAGKFAEAAKQLGKVQPSEKLAQVYRTIFFAQASLAANSKQEADSALEATLRWARGPVWQRHLYSLRLKAFDFKTASQVQRKAFCLLGLKAPLESGTQTGFYYQLLSLDSANLSASERMNVVRQLLRIAPANSRLDSVYQNLVVQFPPGQGSWEEQKLLLDFEQKLGYTQKALERTQTLLPLAPGKPQQQALELNSADLLYRKGSYADAIQSYQKYADSYGPLPDIFLQTARAYRKLSNESQAKSTYAKLTDQFPKSPKSMDVYWMQAFDAEAAGRLEESIETYSRLVAGFPEAAQAEKAAFRIGLAYFKRGDFAAALQAFRNLRRLNSSSRVLHAGLYWEGKSLEAQGDSVAANGTWTELSGRFPFSFYGHLARLNLKARNVWPDSLEWKNRFSPSRAEDIKSWLASHTPGYRDTLDLSGQSVYLPVSRLFEWKMEDLALLTLRSQPASFLANPWGLYVIARQCQDAGLWTEAYRFGTLLGNLLPVEQWAEAPRSVLRLFYPPAYENLVRKWAVQDGVPPGFVFALMKQESGFDAQIVSRAGARGLMQMMPATGASQAKHDGVSGFTPDALFVPDTNVRLGTAYVRDIERKYHGNLYFTLAHYNAGPEALNGWMPQLINRPVDEMVEDIGFSETRDYVKRVLSNYWTYQALYE